MAGPKIADRVKETSTTTGTGTLDLAGAVTGFQTFVAGIGTGNTCIYAIVHRTAAEWEIGLGTVTDASPDTLARTIVIKSSNSNAAVNFSSGTKDVFVTRPSVWGPGFPIVPPTLQSWSWDNQHSATETQVGDALCLNNSAQGAVEIAMRYKTAPTAPYKIDAIITSCHGMDQSGHAGFAIGWSDGTKWHVFNMDSYGGGTLYSRKFSSATTYSADYSPTNTFPSSMPWMGSRWMIRIEDDNTNRKIHLSDNGEVWQLFHSVGRTDYFTPTRVGWGLFPYYAITAQMTLHSWYEH